MAGRRKDSEGLAQPVSTQDLNSTPQHLAIRVRHEDTKVHPYHLCRKARPQKPSPRTKTMASQTSFSVVAKCPTSPSCAAQRRQCQPLPRKQRENQFQPTTPQTPTSTTSTTSTHVPSVVPKTSKPCSVANQPVAPPAARPSPAKSQPNPFPTPQASTRTDTPSRPNAPGRKRP